MATLYLAGYDVEAEWPTVQMTSRFDLLHRAETILAGVAIPGVAGLVAAGPVDVPARSFAVGLEIDETSVAGVRQRIHEIRGLIGSHLVEVRVADGIELVIDARCVGGDAVPDAPGLVSHGGNAELRFVADHPFWRYRYPEIYHLGTSLVAIPLGNAPSSALWELFSADGNDVDDPVITVCDHTGTPRRVTTFTGLTIPGDDVLTLETDPLRQAVLYSDAGVVAQDDTLLPSGQLLPPALDPHAYGNPYRQNWPMAKVTAASGTPAGRLTVWRQFL